MRPASSQCSGWYFSQKVDNAYLAGAEGVVIFNNVDGAAPITMGGDDVQIPAVQIGNEDGVALGSGRGVEGLDLKSLLDGVESEVTLYDLRTDPLAQHDLFPQNHPEADRLGAVLNGWLKDTGQWVRFDEALAASKAKEEELRALGYLR